MPWRAPTAHNAVIRAVAKEHGAVLADVEAAFAEAAPAQGVGWEWMVDHVHFSVAGQALLARTVLHSVAALQAIDLGLLRSARRIGALWATCRWSAWWRTTRWGRCSRKRPCTNTMGTMRAISSNWRPWRAAAVAGRTARRRAMDAAEAAGPLVLAVADQLFSERDFVRAQVHYAAARARCRFTRRGLWAAVQWGWCIKRQGMALTDGQRDEVRAVLKQAGFLAHDPAVGASFVEFVKGQLYHLLADTIRPWCIWNALFWPRIFAVAMR